MSQYRRYYQAGGNYFFTLVTYQRQPIFSVPRHVQQLKSAINEVKKKYPFSLNAIVVLPDHLHCLWKLPDNDKDFSTRWRLIKRYFSLEMNVLVNNRGEKKIWQRRFWEHVIRDEVDWKKHIDYIHYNPVKHGLVQAAGDWHNSSFSYWVEKGLYEKDWGSMESISIDGINEAE